MTGKIPWLTAALCGSVCLVLDSAFAQTWVQASTPDCDWRGIACSADGTRLVAAANYCGTNNGIYISTDSGITWTKTSAPTNSWFSVASSADGTHLVAAAGYGPAGPIYTSTNSGATWMSNSAPVLHWWAVASSADGTKLAAVSSDTNGGVYTSFNSGIDWTSNSLPAKSWYSIACSADGTKLVAAAWGPSGAVYTSTNSGASWTKVSSTFLTASRAVACSADGSMVFVLDGLISPPPNTIYVSTNFGLTWMTNKVSVQIGQTTGASIDCSADGTKIVAVAGYIYTSTNSGLTWQTNDLPDEGYGCVATSADGNRLMVVSAGYPGHIYTAYSTPLPLLKIASVGDDLDVSWTVPATNFVLEQNPDLCTANWTPVTNAPVLNLTNLQDEVSLSPTASNAFYRLATP
jgi:hypothetical protein